MKRKVWAVLTALTVGICSSNLHVMAEENTENTEAATQQMAYALPFNVEEDGVNVDFKLSGEWDGGYQCEIVLTNVGAETLENWQIDFETSDIVTNIWNGNVNKNEAGVCSISALDYNDVLEPGASVSLGYSANGNNYNVEHLEISVVDKEPGDTTIESDVIPMGPYVYYYDNYTVEYIVKNTWSENCNVCLKITNTSTIDIENWKLVWESEDTLSNAYNAEMECKDNVYTLKNLGYNQDILAGETIEVGFDVYFGEALDVPRGFVIPDASQTIIKEGYTVESIVVDAWDTGYTGEIYLTNTGSTVLRDWYLTVQSEDLIKNIWMGTLTDLGNGLYGIKNPDHAQNLQPGETIIIGFQAEGIIKESMVPVMLSVLEENESIDNPSQGENEGDDTEEGENGTDEGDDDDTPVQDEPLKDKYIEIQTVFEDIVMDTAYCVEEEIISYHGIVNNLFVVERVEYEIEDAFENIVQTGEVLYDAESGAWTIDDFGLVIGWNNVIFRIHLSDGTVVEEVHSYMNSSIENMEKTNVGLTDTDGDGINDYFESIYGTDINKADSEGDGLNDLEEMLSGTDPAVQDANEDVDGDGLSTLDELKYGTSPMYPDSDLDGIDDKTEVAEVGTNPVKEDTDGDGLTDGEELKLGTNPLVADSDGDGIIDSEEKIEQEVALELAEEIGAVSEVTVSLACSEDIEHQVFIRNTIEEDELSANVVGLVGVPIEINSMTAFDEAEITFKYDRTQLGDAKEENLCIMWYDEENMTYVMLEDSVLDTESQTVSVTTTHFSTYLLIDKEIWLDAWRSEIDYDEVESEEIQSTYDIFVCIDYSMSPEEFALGKQFVQKIIDQMVEGDRISIGVAFEHGMYNYYLLESKKDATTILKQLETGVQGGQYKEPSGTYKADLNYMVWALYQRGQESSTNEKMGIIVNSGKNAPTFYIHSDADVKRYLKEMDFPVYSVSVTYEEDEEFVDMLEEFGGKGFVATTSDSLITDYHLGCKTLDMLDTDGDGLADTYEISGVRIQNGTVAYTDPYSVDSDRDGVTDYAELGGIPSQLQMFFVDDEFVTTINYQVSDPNDSGSTGKEISAGYMIVDDFNYLPYNKSTYEAIFFKDTLKLDANGNRIYGLYNIYNSNPDELSEKEIEKIVSRINVQCFLCTGYAVPLSVSFLKRYINDKSERNFFDGEDILAKNSTARDVLALDAWYLMKVAEEYLEPGESVIITQTPNNENSGIEFSLSSMDGFFSIHYAESRVIAKVSYDGKQYKMDLKYCLFDYYDWNEALTRRIGLVSDNDLYKLCRSGRARFYENWGLYETQLIWEPNEDSRQNALEREKDDLNGFLHPPIII